MRVPFINGLGADGKVTITWISAMKHRLTTQPKTLRADYVKLVKSLAKLHLVEATLREQVLYADMPSRAAVQEVEKSTPVFGTVFEDFLSSAFGKASKVGEKILNRALTEAVRKI